MGRHPRQDLVNELVEALASLRRFIKQGMVSLRVDPDRHRYRPRPIGIEMLSTARVRP